MSEDPLDFGSRDANFYRYTANNPIRFKDATGMYEERVPADTYAQQVKEGWQEIQRTRFEWAKRNLKNSDEYFHCLINCRAAKAGAGGKDLVSMLGVARELYQLPKDGKEACMKDIAANKAGLEAAKSNQSCENSCTGYKFNSLINPKN